MSIGIIYGIYWWDLDIIYVGQTSNKLSVRAKQHISSLEKRTHYNKKVQEAYNRSKNYEVILLDTCSLIELDNYEMYWIAELDAANPLVGANKTFGGGSAGKGLMHARSKYTKSQVLKVFSLILRGCSVVEITQRVQGVTSHLVYDIKKGNGHRWLKEEYPEEYSTIESKEFKSTTRARGDKIQTKRESYPAVVDSDGIIYADIVNLRAFCRNHKDLCGSPKSSSSDLSNVMKGTRKSCRGFTLYNA